MLHRLLLLLVALTALLGAADAGAWSAKVHRVIADLAERQLTPAARSAVRNLLADAPGQQLADIAAWADELRDDPARRELGKATAPMHYVNFADARCSYQPARDCRDGRCVVMAIEHYAAILADRSRSRVDRAEALRFVVHFVGDVHQPLHAGYRRDKGGNDYQVQFNGKGSNLHAIWDREVVADSKVAWQRTAEALAAAGPLPADGRAQDWAEQSCRISRDDGVYPDGRRIDAAYVQRERPIAERQVRRAAARLAALLNRGLG